MVGASSSENSGLVRRLGQPANVGELPDQSAQISNGNQLPDQPETLLPVLHASPPVLQLEAGTARGKKLSNPGTTLKRSGKISGRRHMLNGKESGAP